MGVLSVLRQNISSCSTMSRCNIDIVRRFFHQDKLEAFVQSQKNNPGKLAILPVYLGLPRNDCTRNETRRLHWLSVWQEWAKTEDRIEVGKWEDALKVFGPSNGIEYVESLGEVALREQIVSAVRRLIPPESS